MSNRPSTQIRHWSPVYVPEYCDEWAQADMEGHYHLIPLNWNRIEPYRTLRRAVIAFDNTSTESPAGRSASAS